MAGKMMGKESSLVSSENPLMDKKYLVRLVEANRTNLHIYDLRLNRVLHLRGAGKYKLLQLLIRYLKKNGVKKEVLVFYPSQKRYFKDVWYEKELTASEIINLLDVTVRNRHTDTLKKIMDFMTTLWIEKDEKDE